MFSVFRCVQCTSVCAVCDQCRVAHVVVSKDEFIRLVLVPPWVRTHAPRAYTQHVTLVSHRSRAVRIGARELHLLEPPGHHAPRPASPVSFTTRCSAVSTRDLPQGHQVRAPYVAQRQLRREHAGQVVQLGSTGAIQPGQEDHPSFDLAKLKQRRRDSSLARVRGIQWISSLVSQRADAPLPLSHVSQRAAWRCLGCAEVPACG